MPLEEVGPAGALFSDGVAAAFVLCNDLGLSGGADALSKLLSWGNMLLPDTVDQMFYTPVPQGFRRFLSRDIAKYAQNPVGPLYDKLFRNLLERGYQAVSDIEQDWALHPGGKMVIDGVQEIMSLCDHQLRATKEIYKTCGNSSSSTVLIVLDWLCAMSTVGDRVVACSFGPGLSIETAMLRSCATSNDTNLPKQAVVSNPNSQYLSVWQWYQLAKQHLFGADPLSATPLPPSHPRGAVSSV